jgi:drug/metabolite transporter (DMT)-like permease
VRRALTDRPALGVLLGAVTIAFSGILFRKSHVSPTTGAFFRCFWALPFLWPLAVWEDRRIGARPWTLRRAAWIGGVFFAADLVLWHYSIEYVGAGLATVLGNTQVVLVGLLAWVIFRERPTRNSLLAIPVAMVGIVLISGVLESGAYGSNPKLGAIYGLLTGVAYSGFLLALRWGSGERGRVAGPLYDATLASAICVVPIGLVIGNLDFTPGLEAQGWLITLALSSQVLGWLLITVSLGRLPTALTSVLLTLQPLLAVCFAALLVDERPSPLQLVGAALILSGLLIASTGRREKAPLDVVPEH